MPRSAPAVPPPWPISRRQADGQGKDSSHRRFHASQSSCAAFLQRQRDQQQKGILINLSCQRRSSSRRSPVTGENGLTFRALLVASFIAAEFQFHGVGRDFHGFHTCRFELVLRDSIAMPPPLRQVEVCSIAALPSICRWQRIRLNGQLIELSTVISLFRLRSQRAFTRWFEFVLRARIAYSSLKIQLY